MDGAQRPAIVMDCGTGYTKLGYAGNVEPSYCFPTAISSGPSAAQRSPSQQASGLEDLDFCIGDEALAHGPTCPVTYPIKHGMVENWGSIERFWQQCIFKYLRVDPEDHLFVLTEPPLNTPENREYTAEIMFETFNVSGLFIGVQAVLALYASLMAADATSEARINPAGGLTGTVVDVGDGVTHVIPIVDSYVIASSIKSIPIAGRDVSAFVQQLIRDRGESVPADMALEVAKAAKEKYCYVCPDVSKEFVRFDADRARAVKQYKGINNRTGQEFMCDIGPERFLGPEIFFTPEMYNSNHSRSLPCVVDDVIQLCPIDTKRALYRNIVLSGGSTMFKGFGRRLGRDLRARVNSRLADNVQPVDVHVLSHPFQRYAVWLGGSLLATRDEFRLACKSREDYQEHGPSICRTNYVFRDV